LKKVRKTEKQEFKTLKEVRKTATHAETNINLRVRKRMRKRDMY
jgi:hypothetical protein